MKKTLSIKTGEVSFTIDKKLYALELLQGAAYVLTDRAAAYVEERGKSYVVTLESKEGKTKAALEALTEVFVNEVLNQALRQKLIANNRVIMEHVITRAMMSARAEETPEGQPVAEPALTSEQQAEIDKLIAEAEAEIASLTKRKGGADPLGITKTWEERHAKPRTD